MDSSMNEYCLFHGASFETAVKIAQEGFDFRPGDYGRGTYFTSQACKSHYSALSTLGVHTRLVCRVTLGDVYFAENVNRALRRPPLHEGTSRVYDTVHAKPGPMPGHPAGAQAHQEFVTFEKAQAYPEFIVQYTCHV
mmetsp:Transcript_101151/g.193826  ORF Transcript_101151/g.193826 Transcript_101151/m.193826 type:complete len:137 (+) Transcript_101151:1-411(+)